MAQVAHLCMHWSYRLGAARPTNLEKNENYGKYDVRFRRDLSRFLWRVSILMHAERDIGAIFVYPYVCLSVSK